jgi:hypothetical protein
VNDAELENLLKSADAAAPIARLREDLPMRVRRRARRRLKGKIVTVVVLLAPLLSLPVYLAQLKTPEIAERKAAPSTMADLKTRIAALDIEARQHELAAMRLEQQESLLQLRQREARAVEQTFEELTADRCITAQLMVGRADDLSQNSADHSQAVREYERVLEMFSQTPQAAMASQRLRELKTQT